MAIDRSHIAVVCVVHFPGWGEPPGPSGDSVEQIHGQMALDLFVNLAEAGTKVYAVFAQGGVSPAYAQTLSELSHWHRGFHSVLAPGIQPGEFTKLLQHGIRMAAQSGVEVIGLLVPDSGQTVDWLDGAEPILRDECSIVVPSRYGSPDFDLAPPRSLLHREREYNSVHQETFNMFGFQGPLDSPPLDIWSRTLLVANREPILLSFLAEWRYEGHLRAGDPMLTWLGGMVLPFGLSRMRGRRIRGFEVPFESGQEQRALEQNATLVYGREELSFDIEKLLFALLLQLRQVPSGLFWR